MRTKYANLKKNFSSRQQRESVPQTAHSPLLHQKSEKMESNNKVKNVIMAAWRISAKHNRRELIRHEEWKELEESLEELKKTSEQQQTKVGFHSR